MRRRLAPALFVASAFMAAACSKSPTTPGVTNTAPTIESILVASQRVEADQTVQITATVKDAESPVNQLTYTWSATPAAGSFSGTGSAVAWRAPKGQTTPAVYTISLTVTEHYTSAGQAKVNTVSSSATVHYNDSPAETVALATQFIRDFGTFSVGPDECVRNFSDTGTCADEKLQERDEIEGNRENFHILSSSFTPATITFDSGFTAGTVEGPCQFEDIPNSGPNAGRREFVSGTCLLTTVYENFRWYLCKSNFNGPFNTELASLKGRVPGRPYGR